MEVAADSISNVFLQLLLCPSPIRRRKGAGERREGKSVKLEAES